VVPPFRPAGAKWLPIPGYAGWYEASDAGDVWSLRRSAAGGGQLDPQVNSAGYRVVRLSKYGQVKTIPVGRLVLLTFRGPPPRPGARARHGKGGPRDDSLENLWWS
jgi:hypothetical protein